MHVLRNFRVFLGPVPVGDDDGSRLVEPGHEDGVLVRRGDVERRDEPVRRVRPVQPAGVQRQSVDHVVDAVELTRRRVRHAQRVDRLAARAPQHQRHSRIKTELGMMLQWWRRVD